MTNTETLQVTDRSKIQRRPRIGHHDRAIVNQILDEALVVHVGFVVDGQPFVIPMGYGRDDELPQRRFIDAAELWEIIARRLLCLTSG